MEDRTVIPQISLACWHEWHFSTSSFPMPTEPKTFFSPLSSLATPNSKAIALFFCPISVSRDKCLSTHPRSPAYLFCFGPCIYRVKSRNLFVSYEPMHNRTYAPQIYYPDFCSVVEARNLWKISVLEKKKRMVRVLPCLSEVLHMVIG